MTKQYIYGWHSVLAILKHQPHSVQKLFIQQGKKGERLEELLTVCPASLAIEYVNPKVLAKYSDEANHQGIVAQTVNVLNYHEADIPQLLAALTKPALVLILDGVADPHNLGACLRTADAAGVDIVIAPKDRAVGLTPTVRKVACGAAEVVPFIQVSNLARTMRQLQEAGLWIYGAAGEAEKSIYDVDFTGAVAIVLGAEEKGLRRLTREHCDALMVIPMHGTVASLNVSVATGICLFEAKRQR